MTRLLVSVIALVIGLATAAGHAQGRGAGQAPGQAPQGRGRGRWPAGDGSCVGAEGLHRLLGVGRHRALASAHARSTQRRLRHAAPQPRGAQDCRLLGPRQGEGGSRPVQGVRSRRAHASAWPPQYPLDRRQHVAARHRLRHADAHLQVWRRSVACRPGAAAAGRLRCVVGIPRRARPRRRSERHRPAARADRRR